MNTINFDNLNSYEDLGLILTKKVIGSALPKTSSVNIPGGDGQIDYTEYFGKVNYSNRTLVFEFSTIVIPSDFLTLYSNIQNLLSGRKMKISIDDEPGWYYVGRVIVEDLDSNSRGIGHISITVNAEPYKLQDHRTVVSAVIDGETVITCWNDKKHVIPTITTTSPISITFKDHTATCSDVLVDEDIIFIEGQNVLVATPSSATGTAVITVEYQEGKL